MKLSENFTFDELTSTSQSDLLVLNRHEAEAFEKHLKYTAGALEEIRAILGVKLKVTSGFRGYSLNKRVGGSPTSSHSKGLAADIVPDGIKVTDAFNKIMTNKDELHSVRKVILELVNGKSWLHIQAKIEDKEPLEFYTTKDGKSYTKV